MKKKKKKKINISQIFIATFWVLFIFALVAFTIIYDPNSQYSGDFFGDVAKTMKW